jgi:hypothetical protein
MKLPMLYDTSSQNQYLKQSKRKSKMATANTLHVVSLVSTQDLPLIKAGGHYQRGDEILIGDLYGDESIPESVILVVSKIVKVETLSVKILAPAKTKNGA